MYSDDDPYVTYLKLVPCIISQGSNNARVSQEGHDRCVLFGLGQGYHRNDAERLARMLVMKDVLKEKLVIGSHDNVISYTVLGPKAKLLVDGKYKVCVAVARVSHM